jgi:hypothetical protein
MPPSVFALISDGQFARFASMFKLETGRNKRSKSTGTACHLTLLARLENPGYQHRSKIQVVSVLAWDLESQGHVSIILSI